MCDWKHWLTLGENAAISTGDSEEKATNSWDYYDEEYCLRKLGLINRERDDIGF
jgi:hypothetical protein